MASFERILIKNLTKSFGNADGVKNTIFENVSFELDRGAVLRLTGASGSGKTTFMNVMSGLIKPDSGSVFFGNTDITSLSEGGKDRFRAENIGYIFQTFNLLSPFRFWKTSMRRLPLRGDFRRTTQIRRCIHWIKWE